MFRGVKLVVAARNLVCAPAFSPTSAQSRSGRKPDRLVSPFAPKRTRVDRPEVGRRQALQGVGNSQRRAARSGDRDEPGMEELGARNSGPATSVEAWEPEIGPRDVKSAAGARLDSAQSLRQPRCVCPRAK